MTLQHAFDVVALLVALYMVGRFAKWFLVRMSGGDWS